jgi:methylated-DNA-[protein]-cysteine S-methyltransferase
VRCAICNTRLGWVGVGLEGRAIRATTLPRARREQALEDMAQRGAVEPAEETQAAEAVEMVRRWFAGEAVDLGLRLDLPGGTAFQRAVWRGILEIPRGETRSYGWLAERIGRPGAARAVGQAVGANPLPLLVPCHRVVASDGGLGGFGGGADSLKMKEALLRLEGAVP